MRKIEIPKATVTTANETPKKCSRCEKPSQKDHPLCVRCEEREYEYAVEKAERGF